MKLCNNESNSIDFNYAILRNDIVKLRNYGAQGIGFKNNDLRKKIWNILICPENESLNHQVHWELLPVHKDENQVQLDVDRSFIYYPINSTHKELKKKKKELKSLILEILRKHPTLNYFQGYHNIAQVFLLCVGKKDAVKLLEYISLTRIRDFFLPSLSPILDHLELIKSIIFKKDQELGEHVANVPSHFALASYLTWFSYKTKHFEDILKVFDFILATDTIMIIYIYAAVSLYSFITDTKIREIIIQQKNQILNITKEETDILHKVLANFTQKCPSKSILQEAISLRENIPPYILSNWKYTLKYSCIKDFGKKYHLEYATKLYYMELDELEKKSHCYISNRARINSTLFIITIAILSISIAWYKNFIKNI
ncbi:GTPase-activating protein GYP8 [Pneumocystis jirovecii RU7]|uniref:Rab-GAP TBC domain-containing protein n=1 Tax=Pneumocystis jirovecii (strain RU7) TaxID=1408657 RepID=A0A0W4ZIZ0_PNEJ7|nr:GTPase-activating protein GYP8 [Pneumocystis jirovecii RU7]KTW28337.1 hypothetical protein T551_02756 [Pneumocystis jirovecii RU7]